MMIYISKGVVQKNSTEQNIRILRGGQVFQLTGVEAQVWLDGRLEFAIADAPARNRAVEHLSRMGLAEYEQEDSPVARYRILTRSVCCAAVTHRLSLPVRHNEKEILKWLRNAGLRLSTAELVFLQEHQIKPVPQLLYAQNRQALTEAIYMRTNIGDNLLECQMEHAKCRDDVVRTLMSLLRKKKILIL